MVNPNIIINAIFFYYTLGIAIDYLLIFFDSVLKVYFDKFSKKQVFNIVMSISLKCIGSKFAIFFDIHNDL